MSTLPQGAVPRDAASSNSTQGGWQGNANVLIGGRQMDDELNWEPLEDQFALGVELDFRPEDFPLGFEVGLQGSITADEILGVTVTASVVELYFGPRVTLDLGQSGFHPYFGAGVTLLAAELEAESGGFRVSDDDSTAGGYAHGGVYYRTQSNFNIGLDVRHVTNTDINLFGGDGDADYFQVALLLGGSF